VLYDLGSGDAALRLRSEAIWHFFRRRWNRDRILIVAEADETRGKQTSQLVRFAMRICFESTIAKATVVTLYLSKS